MHCHFLLQGIFLTQGSNLGLPYCRQILYHLSYHLPTVFLNSSAVSLNLLGLRYVYACTLLIEKIPISKELSHIYLSVIKVQSMFSDTKLSNMLVWYHHSVYWTQNNYQVGFGSFMKICLIHFLGVNSFLLSFCVVHILKFKKHSTPLLTIIHLHNPQPSCSLWTLKLNRSLDNAASLVSGWSLERSTLYLIFIFWISTS